MPTLSGYDREQLACILRRQYDVISRKQALECGMTRGTIEYRLRPDGPWRQILPAVYLTVTGTASADQRETAALLYAGPQSVITGPVAVRRHNLRCAGLNLLDVLVPADSRRKSTGYVQIQRTIRMPGDLYTTGPVRFTALARAVADAARGMTRFSDVQALVCEAVQRSRCTLDELVQELNEGPSAGARWYRPPCATTGWKRPESMCCTGCPARSRPSRPRSSPAYATRSRKATIVPRFRSGPSRPRRDCRGLTRRVSRARAGPPSLQHATGCAVTQGGAS